MNSNDTARCEASLWMPKKFSGYMQLGNGISDKRLLYAHASLYGVDFADSTLSEANLSASALTDASLN